MIDSLGKGECALYEGVCECAGLFAFTVVPDYRLLSHLAQYAANAVGLFDPQKHAGVSGAPAGAWVLHEQQHEDRLQHRQLRGYHQAFVER